MSTKKAILTKNFVTAMLDVPKADNINTRFTKDETQFMNRIVQLCRDNDLLTSVRFLNGPHTNNQDYVSVMIATGNDGTTALFYVIKKSSPKAFAEYTALMRDPDLNTLESIRIDTVNFAKIADQLNSHFFDLRLQKTPLILVP